MCINDTDKKLGTCNADKVDGIKKCVRQLQEPDIYKKLSFEEMVCLIKEIQTKLNGIIDKFEYKGCITQSEKKITFQRKSV